MSVAQVLTLIVGALAPSCLISWAAGYAVRRWAPRLGLVDQPGHRKVHATPTPLGGGIAIWLGLVLPLTAGSLALATWRDQAEAPAQTVLPRGGQGVWAEAIELARPHVAGLWSQLPALWTLIGVATVLMLLGLADDRQGVDWRWRLTVQALVALAAVAGCHWRFRFLDAWPWLTGAVSAVWIVGLVNSFNMLDNMDGLSAGIATISAITMAGMMLLVPNPQTHQPHLFIAGLLLVLAGALLGFLWHNRPTARLFMGDAGSYLIGFLLAAISLMATQAGDDLPRHAILAPPCIFAVPLYDLITVVAIRLRRGQSPFAGDKNHFSHRLVELGLSKTQAVLTIYLLTATCGLGALLLHQVDLVGAATIVLLIACVLVVIGILETAARRKARSEKSL